MTKNLGPRGKEKKRANTTRADRLLFGPKDLGLFENIKEENTHHPLSLIFQPGDCSEKSQKINKPGANGILIKVPKVTFYNLSL